MFFLSLVHISVDSSCCVGGRDSLTFLSSVVGDFMDALRSSCKRLEREERRKFKL